MAQRLELTAMSVTHVGAPDFPCMLQHDPTRSPVLFFRGKPCAKSYADKQGKYQGQRGITLPKVER